MKIIRALAIMFLAVASITACTSNPLQNIADRPVPDRIDGSAQTEETVRTGIISGCIDKGWTCHKTADGLIEASINVRKHRAVATIAYDTDSYSITYKSSKLLDYNPSRNTIHRNYNRWIANLDAAIAKRLAL